MYSQILNYSFLNNEPKRNTLIHIYFSKYLSVFLWSVFYHITKKKIKINDIIMFIFNIK